jgi:hypothetical protein
MYYMVKVLTYKIYNLVRITCHNIYYIHVIALLKQKFNITYKFKFHIIITIVVKKIYPYTKNLPR